MNKVAVAKELAAVAKLLEASDFEADDLEVKKLADKMMARLPADVKNRTMKQYGIEIHSSDKVLALFEAVAKVYLGQSSDLPTL